MQPDHIKFKWLAADWPAPENIHAGCTTRGGGTSRFAYDSLNLAAHVGDDERNVLHNRRFLIDRLNLPAEPVWLEQKHGCRIINPVDAIKERQADGMYTDCVGHVCVVLTADCLPLLICDRSGQEIAAIHIGWRGYAKNIVAAAIKTFRQHPRNLLAWIGPCISARHYEVGREVRDACVVINKESSSAFSPSRKDHWFADIQLLVRFQLRACGLENISGGEFCTFTDKELFYSFRRDGVTGRMASLIWMDS